MQHLSYKVGIKKYLVGPEYICHYIANIMRCFENGLYIEGSEYRKHPRHGYCVNADTFRGNNQSEGPISPLRTATLCLHSQWQFPHYVTRHQLYSSLQSMINESQLGYVQFPLVRWETPH